MRNLFFCIFAVAALSSFERVVKASEQPADNFKLYSVSSIRASPDRKKVAFGAWFSTAGENNRAKLSHFFVVYSTTQEAVLVALRCDSFAGANIAWDDTSSRVVFPVDDALVALDLSAKPIARVRKLSGIDAGEFRKLQLFQFDDSNFCNIGWWESSDFVVKSLDLVDFDATDLFRLPFQLEEQLPWCVTNQSSSAGDSEEIALGYPGGIAKFRLPFDFESKLFGMEFVSFEGKSTRPLSIAYCDRAKCYVQAFEDGTLLALREARDSLRELSLRAEVLPITISRFGEQDISCNDGILLLSGFVGERPGSDYSQRKSGQIIRYSLLSRSVVDRTSTGHGFGSPVSLQNGYMCKKFDSDKRTTLVLLDSGFDVTSEIDLSGVPAGRFSSSVRMD